MCGGIARCGRRASRADRRRPSPYRSPSPLPDEDDRPTAGARLARPLARSDERVALGGRPRPVRTANRPPRCSGVGQPRTNNPTHARPAAQDNPSRRPRPRRARCPRSSRPVAGPSALVGRLCEWIKAGLRSSSPRARRRNCPHLRARRSTASTAARRRAQLVTAQTPDKTPGHAFFARPRSGLADGRPTIQTSRAARHAAQIAMETGLGSAGDRVRLRARGARQPNRLRGPGRHDDGWHPPGLSCREQRRAFARAETRPAGP